MPSYDEAVAMITGPGSPFELTTETVNGIEMPVFKQRARSLREVLAKSLEHGDAELAVFDKIDVTATISTYSLKSK